MANSTHFEIVLFLIKIQAMSGVSSVLARSSFIIPGLYMSLSGVESPQGTDRTLAERVKVEVNIEALWMVNTVITDI